jgi:arylsulfatase A-like enzyme
MNLNFIRSGWRAVILSGFVACVAPLQSYAGDTRPNIIFLLTDDMGYGDVGCYGGNFVPTPNIDRLAAEGTKFTQFYVASPVCSPSRTGFLTGMYPARWRITNFLQTRAGNRKSEQADFLDPKAPSIARTLKAAGYVTGHFGKWHMGGGRDVTNAPPFREYGFDEHAGTWESPEPDPNITATNWIWSAQDKVKRWDRTAYFVDKTLDFLKRHKGQPCYVDVWPDDVHTPWVPEGAYREKRAGDDNAPNYESLANFKAVLREYDRQVGRLLDGLKDLGMGDNTILIFSSDNGPLPTFRGKRAGGLRGSKISLYEGGDREPLIVRWPGHFPAGRVDDKTVISGVDFFPIFCKLTGTPIPSNAAFDGEDLTGSFFGKSIFWLSQEPARPQPERGDTRRQMEAAHQRRRLGAAIVRPGCRPQRNEKCGGRQPGRGEAIERGGVAVAEIAALRTQEELGLCSDSTAISAG